MGGKYKPKKKPKVDAQARKFLHGLPDPDGQSYPYYEIWCAIQFAVEEEGAGMIQIEDMMEEFVEASKELHRRVEDEILMPSDWDKK